MPTSIVGAAGFNRLWTATEENRADGAKLYDQLRRKRPILAILNPNPHKFGGRELVLNVRAAELTPSDPTDESGSYEATKSANVLGVAKYGTGAPLVDHIRLPWSEIQHVEGSELIDLVTTYQNELDDMAERSILTRIWAAAGAAGDAASLYDLVSDTVVVGGIDPATHPYWKSTVVTYDVGTAPDAGEPTTVTEGLRALVDGVAEAFNDDDTSNKVLIAGKNVYADYRASFDDAKRYSDVPVSIGDIEFKGLEFDGITMVRDFDCGDDDAFLLDTRHLFIGGVNGQWMARQEPETPVDFDAAGSRNLHTLDKAYPIATIMGTGVSSRRAHGRLTRQVSTV